MHRTCRSSWNVAVGRSPRPPAFYRSRSNAERVFDFPCFSLSVVPQVLYGKLNVRCFDKLEGGSTKSGASSPFDPPLEPRQRASVWRSALRSVAQYSEESGPCLLTPLRDNLHQIDAVDGPVAFLDILAPPYNPDDGRDCHYYKLLQTAADDGTVAKGGQKEKDEEVWLLEIPQPEDFWCGGEPYPGPAVVI
uniref:2-aminoethanethiol (cysteamine) dioxygenase a n=1 Tax=Oryzias sinensis TaxID=183150 RepID=A0A8C8E0V4_9TELE